MNVPHPKLGNLRLQRPSPSDTGRSTPSQQPESSSEPETSPEPQESGPLKEFTLFPDLPPELRCLVWKQAGDFPRLVSMYISEQYVNMPTPNRWGRQTKIVTIAPRNCPRPAVLQVCREGRKECLSLFRIIEGREIVESQGPGPLHNHEGSRQPKVYFNPVVDTVFLRCLSFPTPPIPMRTVFCAESMRRLAIPFQWFAGHGRCYDVRDLLRDLAENLRQTNIGDIMVIMDPDNGNKTVAEDESDEKDWTPSLTGTLEAVEIPWEKCLERKGALHYMRHFRYDLAREKYDAIKRVHPSEVFDFHEMCEPEVWVGGRLIDDGTVDGTGSSFNQSIEKLVTSEVEKIFKCPKIRIMGVSVNGKPCEA